MFDEEDEDKKGSASGSDRAMDSGAKKTWKNAKEEVIIDEIKSLLKEFETASIAERKIIINAYQ